MAIWRRGSRRLVLVLWIAILLLLLRYRDAISDLFAPDGIRLVPHAPGSDKQPGAATPADHGTKPVDTADAPKAATSPKKKKTGLESAKYFVKSGYDWSKLRRKYPIAAADMVHPPKGPPKSLQRVQYAFPRAALVLNDKQNGQRDAVRKAFKRAWDAYVEHGFPHDELTPVTLRGKDTFGGWAATMVDALDTLYIMGFHDEFQAMLPSVGAIDWSDTELTSLNVFETNIRYLGGLLAAYDLSGEEVLLLKATELGELLYAAFDTPNHMPPFWLDFADAKKGSQRAGTTQPSASPGSLCLEFTRLAQLTGDAKYYDAIDRIKRFLERTQESTLLPGLWPVFLDFERELANNSGDFSIGAQADSLYEYLPKMSALLGGRDPSYEKMYRRAAAAASEHLLFRPMTPDNADVLFAGDAHARSADPEDVQLLPDGQHLSCFAGGMFGLGAKLYGLPAADLATAEKLTRGCAWAYSAFPTGIMPETFSLLPCASRTDCAWNETRWTEEGNERYPKGFRYVRDSRYMLRPEAIESVFLLYRMTGRAEYQDAAWKMFLAVQAATVTDKANSAIADVNVNVKAGGKTEKTDEMESFWLAETLKYFYLVFSPPDVVGLDEWVFNTEAHPLKRPDR